MSLSLPADPAHALRLTDVLPNSIAALEGRSPRLPAVRSVIVFVVDGLGARSLAEHPGYARFLATRATRRSVATTVFPSTTAAALTSLLTGQDVGAHGIVGYRALDPTAGEVRNQLTDWGPGALDPFTWPRAEPLTARRPPRSFVVSRPEYADSGFTIATLRGAEVHGERDLDARVRLAIHLARSTDGALVYLYAPELDTAGHRHGVASAEWTTSLEAVDAAARRLHEAAGVDTGVLLTADHGMVDVPAHRHILLDHGDARLDAVRLLGGEPRMLHLYAVPGRAGELRDAWAGEQDRSWVLTRQEAIDAGLFGESVGAEVRERIGDVLVAARARVAYYDARIAEPSARQMIGQHGSLTPEERIVPLIRLAAFAS